MILESKHPNGVYKIDTAKILLTKDNFMLFYVFALDIIDTCLKHTADDAKMMEMAKKVLERDRTKDNGPKN